MVRWAYEVGVVLVSLAVARTGMAAEPPEACGCEEPATESARPPVPLPMRVGLPPSALEAPLTSLVVDTALPGFPQVGDVNNCGPTAAAMLLATYAGAGDRVEQETLRDAIGYWSWDNFPLRRLQLPGYDAGMTTPGMLRATLDEVATGVNFNPIEHAWIPGEAWSIVALKRQLVDGRPFLALVQASILWGVRTPGLHWVVVRGIADGVIAYNDPADGTRSEVPLARFWLAWRLAEFYRSMPLMGAFKALAPDRPVPALSLAEDAPRPGLPVAR